MGVGFQLNMIDEETLLSAEFPWIYRARDACGMAINIFVHYLFVRRAGRALFLTRLQSTGPGCVSAGAVNARRVKEI